MDRTLDIDLEKQIEKSLFGPKIKVSGNKDFEWGNCRASDPVQLTVLNLPDPIKQGVITMSVTFSVKEDLNDPLNGKVLVQQQDGSKWDNLCPLLKDLAHFDCDVGNICLLLKNIKKCPKVVLDAGWNCKCPMKANTYAISKYTVPVPYIPIQGVFNVSLTLTQNSKQMGCSWVKFKLA